MKTKITLIMGIVTLGVTLAAGISYAWFTDQSKAEGTGAEAGYVDITLDSVSDEADNIFPADEDKEITYTITNDSSREVVVQFKSGALAAYVMPEDYLDGEFIFDEKHELMRGLSPEQKMKTNGATSEFVKLDPVPQEHVAFKLIDTWDLTGNGSDYLGYDNEGNQYFLLPVGGKAEGTFNIGLTGDAGNRYQYAMLALDEAAALATQHNESAIASAFKGLAIADLQK